MSNAQILHALEFTCKINENRVQHAYLKVLNTKMLPAPYEFHNM